MADTYFGNHFPLTIYNNRPVIDITRRAAITNSTLLNPFIFYPSTITNNKRSDQLARDFFDDPYQEWVLFLTNNIIDPYEQWYMNTDEFNDFMIQKYGSIPYSQQHIKYYTNNWYNNLTPITVSAYDALSTVELKYYNPNYDVFGMIISYSRVQEDWTLNTNHLVSFVFDVQIPAFVNNEIVTINYGNTSGSGQVSLCANNILNIQHVSGYYLPNGTVNVASFSITGTQSNSVAQAANSVIINSYDSVTADEDSYYDPVYIYDYEFNKNESNKVINVMLKNYVPKLSSQLRTVINS